MGDLRRALPQPWNMTTAKKKIAPPRPVPNRTWSQLTAPEQNAEYSRALHAYSQGQGENPAGRAQYYAHRAAAESKN